MPEDDMTAEQRPSGISYNVASADSSSTAPGVDKSAQTRPLTPDEQKAREHIEGHSFFSIDSLKSLVSARRNGNPSVNTAGDTETEVGHSSADDRDSSQVTNSFGVASLDEIHREIGPRIDSSLNPIYDEQITAIRILRRDLGQTEQAVGRYDRRIPRHNNVKKDEKQRILERLKRERQSLAIANFPRYIAIWEDLDPEKKEEINELRERFESNGEDREARAAISENARKELDRSLNAKASYYTEMLQTLLIDSGIPYEEAEDIAVSKSLEIIGTNSIPEKAVSMNGLKNEALAYLVSSLHHSIEVWEELYPGKGEEEELKVLGGNENERTKNAKDLYKRIKKELDRRRSDYRLRLVQYFTSAKGKNPIEAARDSVLSERRLMALPRIEQIRIMDSNDFV